MKMGALILSRGEELHIKTDDGHDIFVWYHANGLLTLSDERRTEDGYVADLAFQVVSLTKDGWGLCDSKTVAQIPLRVLLPSQEPPMPATRAEMTSQQQVALIKRIGVEAYLDIPSGAESDERHVCP